MLINADLGMQLEAYVSELVRSGRYRSEAEVLREGVRLIQEREARLIFLDASIERGISDAMSGGTRPIDEVFDSLEEKYGAMSRSAG